MPNKAMLPIGALSVATAIRERGDDVTVFDGVFTTNWLDELSTLCTNRWDEILVAVHTVRNIPAARLAIACVRAKLGSSVHITVGGNVTTDLNIDHLRRLGLEIDKVVTGFGVRGSVVPALDLIDDATHAKYLEASAGKYPIVAFNYGCAYRCKYCSARMDSPLQERNFETTHEEIERARDRGYASLWCVDNLALYDERKALRLDRHLLGRNMRWSGMTRHEDVLRAKELAQFCALDELAMGVETITPRVLSVLKRGASKAYADRLAEAFAALHQAGIPSNAFVMLDVPGTSEEDFARTYQFLCEAHVETVSWSFYNPPPALGLFGRNIRPQDYGFYAWPLGCSDVPQQRVVQQAMLLSGVWWSEWRPEQEPYWEENGTFGVKFKKTNISQGANDRSPTGDLWEIWQQEEGA